MENDVFVYEKKELWDLFKAFEKSHPFFEKDMKNILLSEDFISFWDTHSLPLQKRVILERSQVRTKKNTAEHLSTDSHFYEFSSYLARVSNQRINQNFARLFLADICTFLEWAHDVDFLNLKESLKREVLYEIKTMFLI